MKTIVFVANSTYNLYNYRYAIIKDLIEKGHSVICLSNHDKYVNHLINIGCKYKSIEFNSNGSNPIKDLILLYRLFWLYKKIKPDIIFHFTIKINIFGTYAAFMSNTPCVNNITGLGTIFINNTIKTKICKILYKTTQHLAKKVFCQNQDDYNYFTDHQLIPKIILQKIPGSGVNLKRFHPNLKVISEFKNKQFTFIYFGRIIKEKGLYELIDAFRSINCLKIKCTLWIYGSINTNNSCHISKNTINKWLNKYKWLKFSKSVDDIETVLAQVDCVILPSYREGLPKSLLESCAMEIPIITTDVPGCREIITHNYNGLICQPRNYLSLEKEIRNMLNLSSDERRLMGKRGRKLVEMSYDEKIIINIYSEAVKLYAKS